MHMREEWRQLTEAAREVGISPAKLSKMVKQQRVPSKKDMRDERLTLVEMHALRKVLGLDEVSN